MDKDQFYLAKFSDDCYKAVYDRTTKKEFVIIAVVQLAVIVALALVAFLR